jgi:hypothetical protein
MAARRPLGDTLCRLHRSPHRMPQEASINAQSGVGISMRACSAFLLFSGFPSPGQSFSSTHRYSTGWIVPMITFSSISTLRSTRRFKWRLPPFQVPRWTPINCPIRLPQLLRFSSIRVLPSIASTSIRRPSLYCISTMKTIASMSSCHVFTVNCSLVNMDRGSLSSQLPGR